MKSTNIVLYPSGAYGTFIEWILTFLTGGTKDYPFNENGNSHKFKGNFFEPKEKLFKFLNSDLEFNFSRIHPGLFTGVNDHDTVHSVKFHKFLESDITFLKNNFRKVLVLYFDNSSVLWNSNNNLIKILMTNEIYTRDYKTYGYTETFLKIVMEKDSILKMRHFIDMEINSKNSPLTIQNLQAWSKNTIYDFDIWELRELLSLYWVSSINSQIDAWATVTQDKDVLSISMSELRDNFIQTIIKIAKYFDINVTTQQIIEIEQINTAWRKLQTQIDKDAQCIKIAESIINNIPHDWTNYTLSIIDEAWIQKFLADRGIQIKCYNLNTFPTNSMDFQTYLERSS